MDLWGNFGERNPCRRQTASVIRGSGYLCAATLTRRLPHVEFGYPVVKLGSFKNGSGSGKLGPFPLLAPDWGTTFSSFPSCPAPFPLATMRWPSRFRQDGGNL